MFLLTRVLRIFRRHPLQFVLNIFGLAFGMSVFIAIQLYIGNEKDYDQFWSDSESIFRISASWDTEEGTIHRATLPPPMGTALSEYDDILYSTRILYWSDFTMRPDNDSMNVFRETNIYIADKDFFNVFENYLLAGDPETALAEPGSTVLSESAARRYFGDMPLDKVLDHTIRGGKDGGTIWKITGIMKDIPNNSHMNFDMLVSMWPEFSQNNDWSWHIMHTYVRANKRLANDPDAFDVILSSIVTDRLIPHFVQQGFLEAISNPEDYRLTAINITQIHLQPEWEDSIQPGIRIEYLNILNYASMLIFLLACMNFINISTALSFYRIGEIGVRKIHGASFRILFRMILSEYVIHVFLALLVGLCISELLVLILHQFLGVDLHKTLLDMPLFMIRLSLILLGVTLAASVYPSWLLIRGKSVRMASGKLNFVRGKNFRSSLIVFQFFIAVFLLGFAATISHQLDFIRNRDIGFDRNNLLVIQNDREIEEQREAFIRSMEDIPGVSGASFSTGIPALLRYHIRDVRVRGSEENQPMQWYKIDENFLDVMGIKLLEGTAFQGLAADSGKALLNETAVKLMGLEEPIGTLITINEGSPDEHEVVISGIIRDFNQEGFRLHVQPLILEYLNSFVFKDYITIRYKPQNTTQVMADVLNTWAEYEPQVPISYSFLDHKFQRLYSSEEILSRIIGIFSFLAIVIAGIGLLGVSSVSIEQRTKEIGIRKVFGASTFSIMVNQIRKFAVLVFLGILMAIPLSLYISSQWLESFVYRTDLNPWLFILAAALVMFVCIAVVGLRSFITSLKNPINSLRAE